MPDQTTTIAVVVLVVVLGTVIVLQVANRKTLSALRRDIQERDRRDAATERQVNDLLNRPGGEDTRRGRHLRPVPVFVGVAGGLAVAGRWAADHKSQLATAAGLTAASTALVVAGPMVPEQNEAGPDPRPPVLGPPLTTTPRWPSSTSELPSATTTTTQPAPTTEASVALLPPTSAALTTTTTELPEPPTTTTSMPTPPTSVPPSTRACLARVELGKLVEVCVPTIRR